MLAILIICLLFFISILSFFGHVIIFRPKVITIGFTPSHN